MLNMKLSDRGKRRRQHRRFRLDIVKDMQRVPVTEEYDRDRGRWGQLILCDEPQREQLKEEDIC